MADAQRAMIEQRTAAPVTRQTVTAPAAPPTKAYPPKIAKAILAISRKIQPVEKAGINDFHRYAYPKWEDIRDELWPLVNENGLIIIQNEKAHEGLTSDMVAFTYDFTILNEDGDVWPDKPEVTAICKIRDAKGTLDDKAASKCRTQAEKNAMVQIFKIRTEDVYEVDNEGKVNKNSPRRRQVPSPDGKVAPHSIAIVSGEAPEAWATRFKTFLAKAATTEEVDAWYNANLPVFKRLEEKEEYKAVYDGLVDAMDARANAISAPAQSQQAKPQVEQKAAAGADDFPGDKPMRTAPDIDIPIDLDRMLTEQEKDWMLQISEAYQQCSNAAELAAEQASIMFPSKDTVSDHAWSRAKALTKQHLERVQGQ